MLLKKLTPFAALLVFIACNSNESNPVKNETVTQPAAGTTAAASTAVAEQDNANVYFKVNDTLARTAKGTHANDRDEHIGIYTEASKSLLLSLMGDVAGRPHRGWLTFSIVNFSFEPASYTVTKDNHISFTRYETENASGATEFSASGYEVDKGTAMSLVITKIERDPGSFNGRDWLASGTFSAKMLIKEPNPYKRTLTNGLQITDGTFENVRIAGGPKAP
jgi:hypothetical protein